MRQDTVALVVMEDKLVPTFLPAEDRSSSTVRFLLPFVLAEPDEEKRRIISSDQFMLSSGSPGYLKNI